MPATLTAQERLIYGSVAFDKKADGWSNARIAEHVGVHRNTVPSLLEHEALIRGRDRSPATKAVAIARYERVIETAREELAKPQANGLAKPALLNAIINAQTRIDKLNGDEAPKKLDVTKRNIDLSSLSDDELEEITKLEERMQDIARKALQAPPSEN